MISNLATLLVLSTSKYKIHKSDNKLYLLNPFFIKNNNPKMSVFFVNKDISHAILG